MSDVQRECQHVIVVVQVQPSGDREIINTRADVIVGVSTRENIKEIIRTATFLFEKLHQKNGVCFFLVK
jgi:hypothetical protein